MKTAYISLYFISCLIFLTALLGGSLTKSVFSSVSEKSLEFAGFKKSYFESADDKIDELVYRSRQIELQIEKIKNFFSADKVDENLYKKQKGEMLEKSFYYPMVNMFNFVFRIGFVFVSLFLLSFAFVFHLAFRSMDLRKRVRYLESLVLNRS
jgi:hypothetical protein